MTVVNIHVQPKRDRGADTSWSGWFVGRPNPTTSKFWLTGVAFLVLYSILNKLPAYHQLDGIGITLWSPYNGFTAVRECEERLSSNKSRIKALYEKSYAAQWAVDDAEAAIEKAHQDQLAYLSSWDLPEPSMTARQARQKHVDGLS